MRVLLPLIFLLRTVFCIDDVLCGNEARDTSFFVLAPTLLKADSQFQVQLKSFVGAAEIEAQVSILMSGGTAVGNTTVQSKKATVPPCSSYTIDFQFENVDVDRKYSLLVTAENPADGIKQSTSFALFGVQSKEKLLFLQLNKAWFRPGELVSYRVLLLNNNLFPTTGAVQIRIKTSEGHIVEDRSLISPSVDGYSGFYEGNYSLGMNPVMGKKWEIEITAGHRTERKFFAVEDYELPQFTAGIELRDGTFLTPETRSFTLTITTKHWAVTTGTENNQPLRVRGMTGHVQLTVLGPNNATKLEKISELIVDSADITVQTREIFPTNVSCDPSITQFVTISANVTERVYGQSVLVDKRIPFYCRSFDLKIKPFLPAFHPGLSFNFTITVVKHDGIPELPVSSKERPSMNVVVSITENDDGETNVRTFKDVFPPDNLSKGTYNIRVPVIKPTATLLTISATYGDLLTRSLTVNPYQSPEPYFLQLEPIFKDSVKVNDLAEFRIECTYCTLFVHYLLMTTEGLEFSRTIDASLHDGTGIPIVFRVTQKMAPFSTLVVYYIGSNNQLMAASVEFRVDGLLPNKAELRVYPSCGREALRPGLNHTAHIRFSTNPNSLVGFVAVDKRLLAVTGKGHDLTYDNVEDRYALLPSVLKFVHRSRTPVLRVEDVFSKAGLASRNFLFPSSIFKFAHPWKPASVGASSLPNEMLPEDLQLTERTDFRDSFLFITKRADMNGWVDFSQTVPDSITTWSISAFSLSNEHGIGIVKEPAELKVFQEIFVDVRLPFVMIQWEKLPVFAVIYNYGSEDFHFWLEVDILETGNQLKSSSIPPLTVTDHDRLKVQAVTLEPEWVGELIVTIKLVNQLDQKIYDTVKKSIHVRAKGVRTEASSKSSIITAGASETAVPEIHMPVDVNAYKRDKRAIVPNSDISTLSCSSDTMTPVLAKLSGSAPFDNLINLPGGCCEQNLAGLLPNVFVGRYLRDAGMLDEGRKQLLSHNIMHGFTNQLKYRTKDKAAFVPHHHNHGQSSMSGSTLLTAYVLRALLLARPFISPPTPQAELDSYFAFLETRATPDGSFAEQFRDYKSQDHHHSKQALTAIVLLAYLEDPRRNPVMERAQKFLEGSVEAIRTNPFALAIVSYALRRAGSQYAQQAFDKLGKFATETNTEKFWAPSTTSGKSTGLSVETTGYALLAHVKFGQMDQVPKILQWLLSQRNSLGGFVSTQDTVVALSALASLAKSSLHKNLTVEIITKGLKKLGQFSLRTDNELQHHRMDLPHNVGEIVLRPSGTGACRCQVTHVFHETEEPIVSRVKRSDKGGSRYQKFVDFFYLTASLLADDDKEKTKLLNVCFRYNDTGDSGMVLLEVFAPTGHIFSPSTAGELMSSKSFRVDLVEMEERQTRLIAYLSDLPHEEYCHGVSLVQEQTPDNPMPHPVKIYRYSEASQPTIFLYNVI